MQRRAGRQGYRGRVRTGCLTCRSRRVKCDETKPVCNNCNRLMLQCVYKSPSPHSTTRPAVSNRYLPPSPRLHSLRPASSPGSDGFPQTHSISSSSSSSSSSASSSTPKDRELHGAIQKSPAQSPNQTAFLYQGNANVDVTLCLTKALESRNGAPHDDDDEHHTVGSPLDLISRDIELTATIDILTLRTQSPYMSEVFLEAVDCPGIAPFDRVNWRLAKDHFVHLGKSCRAIASCITALSVLYNEQVYGLSGSGSLSHYQTARSSIHELLSDPNVDFELPTAAVFLLCVFELIHYGDIAPLLREPGSLFMARLRAWSQTPSSHTELSMRIITWLRIIHSSTYRGGAMGLVSDEVVRLFPHYVEPLPNVKPPIGLDPDASSHLYEVLSGPIFSFYFQLQMISGETARLSLYHRSRTKGTDQQEVAERMDSLKSRLGALWEGRCDTLRQSPEDLRSQLAPRTANKIIDLISICEATYHAELVDINRQLGDPVSTSPDSREALRKIREVVEKEDVRGGSSGEPQLNPAYLRPLFLYAIESMDPDQSRWAVDRISEIQGPIFRGAFFSKFAGALAEAQVQNDRRVNSRYFCIWYFGATPPFL